MKITAMYKKNKVVGQWFCMGDNYWLLLDGASVKRTGEEAILLDDLTKISYYPY